jgi:hypothetical protein
MSNVKTQSSNEIFRNNNYQNPNSPTHTVALKRLCRNGKMVKNVMLNQVLNHALKRVQGDKK